MANPLTDKQFHRLLDNRLEKVFYDVYNGLPSIRDNFFKVVKDTKAWSEYYSLGDIPDPEEFHGMTNYQGMSPGYWTKITPKEYAGGITIQRRMIDTDQYDVMEGRTKRLGEAAKRKMNKIAHEVFWYHDSTAWTFMTNEEGVALCSNSHTTKSGTSTASGFDNLSTLPFDAVNLEAVRIQMKQFRNDISERIDTNPDTIVYPTSLAEQVWEVVNSKGKVDEMTNNANFQGSLGWKAIELPYLDDDDTNDWFVVDSSKMKDFLIWVDSVPLEFANTGDFDTMMRKYRSYFVSGWGWLDWRWICGCSVS